MGNIKCIDVSEWNGNINWKKVKSDGIEYAILRAGFGRESTQVDSAFETNYKNAKKAGIKLGVYWYSYADSIEDAIREANACIKVIKGKTFELPVFYDLEENFQQKFGLMYITKMCEAFCDKIKANNYEVGVYANLNWFYNFINYGVLKNKYRIWLAQYHTEPQLKCDMWQYTSSTYVNGVNGHVDMNIIYNNDIISIAGDVNGDTKVNVKDVTLIQKFIAKIKTLTSKQKKKADVNKDGKVDVKDATALQKKISKK